MATWDISTLGICLVRAAKGGKFNADHRILLNTMTNLDFVDCMKNWHQGWKATKKLEPKFGNQADGSLKWYDIVPQDELSYLECRGGRGTFKPPIGRLMENYDVGKPHNISVHPLCWTTKVGMCFPADNPGLCLSPVPGSADCGAPEAACGVWGENWNSSNITKQNMCKQRKNVTDLDCAAITAPYTDVEDFAKYLCRNGACEADDESEQIEFLV